MEEEEEKEEEEKFRFKESPTIFEIKGNLLPKNKKTDQRSQQLPLLLLPIIIIIKQIDLTNEKLFFSHRKLRESHAVKIDILLI